MRDERPASRRSRLSSTSLGAAVFVCLLSWACAVFAQGVETGDRDPLSQIALAEGYAVEVHATGLFLPTAIEFLPNPGEGEDDPYYLVAELQGRINVVTRGGAVSEFATVPTFGEQDTGLTGSSQQGLAGLCITPAADRLYATYTVPDAGGIIRNHIVRFEVSPALGGLRGTDPVELAPDLADFAAAPAHQVGDCVIVGDELYVGVGDGGSPRSATDPDVLLGKVLCMRLDGSPCDEPPYGSDGPSAYVHAKGFRNPFALAYDGERLVVAENGVDLDRFVPVARGVDHLWDGRDASLAAHAELVLPQPFSPVQLVYVPTGAPYMAPDWLGHYVASGFGSSHVPGGIAYFGGGHKAGLASTPPRYLVEYMGAPDAQHFAGIGIGDDGLYVTPMVPLGDLGSVVLRIHYDPENAHPVTAKSSPGLGRGADLDVLNELGCTGCHEIAGVGGGTGPTLDQFGFHYRITQELNSRPYEERLRAMIADPNDPFAHMNGAREQVLAAEGRRRMNVWLYYMIQEPRFDDPERQMPDIGLTPEQARTARAELFRVLAVDVGGGSPWEHLWDVLRFNWAELLVGAGAGAGLVMSALGLVVMMRRRASDRA